MAFAVFRPKPFIKHLRKGTVISYSRHTLSDTFSLTDTFLAPKMYVHCVIYNYILIIFKIETFQVISLPENPVTYDGEPFSKPYIQSETIVIIGYCNHSVSSTVMKGLGISCGLTQTFYFSRLYSRVNSQIRVL